MKSVTLCVMLCAFAGVLALAPAAYADQWSHETRVTFSQPVEIPSMVLPPGTYVFKLLDSQTDRSVVQIFNEDENHLYATILAIPDYRLQPTGKTVIMFEEREAGAPSAIRAWFYPGENYGTEFVYPQPRAAALAQVTHQPVPSMPATEKPPEAAELRKAPVMNQQPSAATATAGGHATAARAGGNVAAATAANGERPAADRSDGVALACTGRIVAAHQARLRTLRRAAGAGALTHARGSALPLLPRAGWSLFFGFAKSVLPSNTASGIADPSSAYLSLTLEGFGLSRGITPLDSLRSTGPPRRIFSQS